jgi:gliding motility-associated-like protein
MQLTVLKLPTPPNTFSPNGDGINDFWEVKYLDQYPGCVVELFDPRGQMLYRSVGYQKPWDGTLNGRILPTGTYYYIIDPKNGRKKMAGFITILK